MRRLAIENYRSIGKCSVELSPLTMLVGKNGAGKSNFLDALQFVAESLQTSLGTAIASRGGIQALLRKGAHEENRFSIELEISLLDGKVGVFGFQIGMVGQGGFAVEREYARALSGAEVLDSYSVDEGRVDFKPLSFPPPPAFPDRLYLASGAGFPAFRPLYQALSSMSVYDFDLEAMRRLQPINQSEWLRRDGSNIANVLARLSKADPRRAERINSYLAAIVPDLSEVGSVTLGPMETLRFRLEGRKGALDFFASDMSDGTLRALGILVAIAQPGDRNEPMSLIGIEEPEIAVHPAAAGALMDALHEAACHVQVIVTSHSPDLLDQIDLDADGLLVVEWQDGQTRIGRTNPASRSAIRDHLFTAGELQRMDQLEPDRSDLERQSQMPLFASTNKA